MALFFPNKSIPVSCNSIIFPVVSFQLFNHLKGIIFCILLLVWGVGSTSATDYYQRQSGNWNSPLSWTTSGAWQATVNNGTYPQAGDNTHLENNGNPATITLTADAQCTNLYFDNSGQGVIAMGNYNLIVSGAWTTDWGCNGTITQVSGYLQINGGVGTISPGFNVSQTIANLRVGSNTFTKAGSAALTVISNYDYNCFESSVPNGINAGGAVKMNATPCNPSLSATTLTSFGPVCTGTTVSPNSFTISGLALTNASVNVAALNGFTFSTTAGGTYTGTLSLSQSGGPYSQTIYVKFTPTSTGVYDGNIVVGGGGASAINVAAVGSGVGSVAPTVTLPTSANIMATTATLGGNITVDGCSSQSITERGIYYSKTNGFADGAGTKVSETGTFGTGVFTENVTGLSPSTTYYYKAYATNSAGSGYSQQGTFNNIPLTYYSMQSGNWTSPSTWTTTGCGGTTNAGTYPGYGDNVVICQSHNITVNTTGLSCNNIDMTAYATQLTLNNNFIINGNLSLSNQSYVSAGTNNLTISGDFSFDGANTYISWTNGSVTFGGNLSYSYNWGTVGLNCSGTGWLIMTGSSKTFTLNSALSIPLFKQPTTGFIKAGGSTLTISNTFDQDCGPAAPSGVTISIPGNTINSACNPTKIFQTLTSGNWNSTSTWQYTTNGGLTWTSGIAVPLITDGSVTIQSGHTVTLSAAAGASNLTINGSLNLGTYALSGTNTFTVASGGSLLVGGTSNFPTGFNTVALSSGSAVNYNYAGDQTVYPTTYSNLTLSGSGIKTTNGVTVIGILSLEGSATTTGTIVPNVASTTLQYNGTTAQNISDNLLLENKTYNLTIANTAAGVNQTTDFTANNNLTVNTGAALNIQPAKTLTVGNIITNSAGTSGIVIQSYQGLANGSLIFSKPKLNPSVPATVQMYSKASALTLVPTPSNYQWQYFGVPVSSAPANPTFNGSWIRQYDETSSGSDPNNGKWNPLIDSSVLTPFTGYEITQDVAKTIVYKGQLVNKDTTITLHTTTGVPYEGQYVLGNPYTAAIDIRGLTFGPNTEATVYLYNTGSLQDWNTNGGGSYYTSTTIAGRYMAIPQSSAGTGSIPYDIPSMSGFLVKATSETADGSLFIPYSSVITKNVNLQRVKQSNTPTSGRTYLEIAVKSEHSGDCMWLINQPGTTSGFDNGWDGYKIFGTAGTPQLYAMEDGKNFQVSTSEDFSDTYLGFQPGEDKEYTLTFKNENLGNYYTNVYLLDLAENKTVDITADSSQYSFTAEASGKLTKRFKIVTIPVEKDTSNVATKISIFSSESTVFLNNLSNLDGEIVVYDMMGRLMKRATFGPSGVTAIQLGAIPGVYVVNAVTGNERVSKRVILGE